MAGIKSYILCGVAALTGVGLAAIQSGLPDSDTTVMQFALRSLRDGQSAQAETLALRLARRESAPVDRAWLIVAGARQQARQYESAVQAYNAYLDKCASEDLRRYVLEQIRLCRRASAGDPAPVAPSKRLTPAEREELARVDRIEHIDSTEHFVVRSRNARLTKLVARQVEVALRRIGNLLLGVQAYPHTVDIYVWTDREEYLANASDAPEWAGGSFSFTVEAGTATRRLDLTQLDDDGNFNVAMLDRVLPHELCHLVVREHFGETECPLFLNEGLAMLAESEVDNQRVLLAGKALMGEAKIDLDALLVTQRQSMSSPAVFYAESYSVVSFVRQQLTDEQFHDFLAHVKDGCSVSDAIQRALYVPHNSEYGLILSAAWERHAIADAQYLQAVSLAR